MSKQPKTPDEQGYRCSCLHVGMLHGDASCPIHGSGPLWTENILTEAMSKRRSIKLDVRIDIVADSTVTVSIASAYSKLPLKPFEELAALIRILATENREALFGESEPASDHVVSETPKKPRITHVAIRFRGVLYSLPAPNRHHDVIWHICRTTGVSTVNAPEDDQGFLVDGGETFYRRKPALLVALESGQCKQDTLSRKLGKLYSEDVW